MHEETWIGNLILGRNIKQIATNMPGSGNHLIGRVSVVHGTMFDEKGVLHINTEDGYWCPAHLMQLAD